MQDQKICERMMPALEQLLTAYRYAFHARQDPWKFAVEISELQNLGIWRCDLRWLVSLRYAEHAHELPAERQRERCFDHERSMQFSEQSCFILTSRGVEVVQSMRAVAPDGSRSPHYTARGVWPPGPRRPEWSGEVEVPRWDAARKELWFRGQLIKRFKLPSPNQEAILMAYQEEGWSSKIDDPLPPLPNQDPKRRLHDTIKNLNRNQKCQLLRFRGNGSGQAVLWEPRDHLDPPRNSAGGTIDSLDQLPPSSM